MAAFIARLSSESGFQSVAASPKDTKILFVQKFVRLYAYGSSTLVLALFLSSIGVSDARIGLFMTLTLIGDVILSFFLTLFADGLGRRRVLAIGALMMVVSGVAFFFTDNYWLLVVASVFGVISPSGNEIGPFRAIEESTLAQLTPKDVRTDILSWYELVGTAGAALGTLSSGMIVQFMQNHSETITQSYRPIFILYSIFGGIKLGLNFLLSEACEPPPKEYDSVPLNEVDDDDQDNIIEPPTKHSILDRIRALIPTISPASRQTVKLLCLLFGVDSFASGLVGMSWLSLYFETKFQVEPKVLGSIFFATNLVSSLSNLVAAPLAKRIGLIKTMVFTHLPSAMFLAAIPVPTHPGLATAFLILRSSTSSMDRAPRQAFLAAAVLSSERTAVMGFVNVVKTLCQSAGPSLTGWLAGSDKFWLAFFIAGGLKASYDLSILRLFAGFQGREES